MEIALTNISTEDLERELKLRVSETTLYQLIDKKMDSNYDYFEFTASVLGIDSNSTVNKRREQYINFFNTFSKDNGSDKTKGF
jgi:ABC-type transporter MlaC component